MITQHDELYDKKEKNVIIINSIYVSLIMSRFLNETSASVHMVSLQIFSLEVAQN